MSGVETEVALQRLAEIEEVGTEIMVGRIEVVTETDIMTTEMDGTVIEAMIAVVIGYTAETVEVEADMTISMGKKRWVVESLKFLTSLTSWPNLIN